MVSREYWTLVQHSGVLTGHTEFLQAVEERSVPSAKLVNEIHRLGGVILDDYIEAADLAEKLNYPPDVESLIPRFRGTFTDQLTLDGSPLAIPKRVIVA